MDWERLAKARLKFEWAMNPALFRGSKIKRMLENESDPDKLFVFGCCIEQAYQVRKCRTFRNLIICLACYLGAPVQDYAE